jgi:hypothetical protein
MEMEQVKSIFKSKGWTLHMRKRRKGTKYVYAARRTGEEIREVYFAPLSKTEQMSEQEVLERLALITK